MLSPETTCPRTFNAFGLFLFVHVTFGSNKFGLSHNCEGQSVCNSDTIYCVDSKNSAAVCNITCAGLYSCARATFVVANSGGLVINCLGEYACQSSTIEWVNNDNLADYRTMNSSVAIGGPLRRLQCEGDAVGYPCNSMSVNGDTQERGLDTTTEWNCAGYGSCQRAEAKFKGAVSIHCNQSESCLHTNVTCLSGGNCRTKSNRDGYSDGATMYCMPGVQHCECGNYWDCITLTAAPIPTSTRIQSSTTQVTTTTTFTTSTSLTPLASTRFQTEPSDDGNDNDNSSVWILYVAIVAGATLILGLIAGYCFGSRKKGDGTEEQSDEPESDGRVQRALISEETPGGISFVEEDSNDSVQKPRVTPYAYYGEEEDSCSEQLEGKPRHIGERPTAGGQMVAATNSGDEMSSKELNDEMMYLSMPESATAGGHVQSASASAHGGRHTTPGTPPPGGSAELVRIFMQMKADARTAEDLMFARKLIAAMTLAPAEMEDEFQQLCQMDADVGFTCDLLIDVANRILRERRELLVGLQID